MKLFNHKLFFKIYLVFIILLFLILDFTSEDPLSTLEYIDYPIWFVSLLGIFGYSFNKKIFNNQFWQGYLFFIIIWDVFVNFHDFDFSYTTQPIQLAFVLILLFLLLIPTYIAIYLYGHENADHTIKKRTKILLSILVLIFISNAVTYKLAYDKISEKDFIVRLQLDAMTLKMYDKNNTAYLKTILPGSINGFFYQASQRDDLKKYSSLCTQFDDELFEIVNRYADNKNSYELLKDIAQGTEEGKQKVRKLCQENKAPD